MQDLALELVGLQEIFFGPIKFSKGTVFPVQVSPNEAQSPTYGAPSVCVLGGLGEEGWGRDS